MFANVILFPLELPVALFGVAFVLIIEGAILWLFFRDDTFVEIAIAVLLMNAGSYLVGYAVSSCLPVGAQAYIVETASSLERIRAAGWWWRLTFGVFLPAAVLTILVETGVFLLWRSSRDHERIAVSVTAANLVTYLLLYAITLVIVMR